MIFFPRPCWQNANADRSRRRSFQKIITTTAKIAAISRASGIGTSSPLGNNIAPGLKPSN